MAGVFWVLHSRFRKRRALSATVNPPSAASSIPRPAAQRDLGTWPAFHGRPVSRQRDQ